MGNWRLWNGLRNKHQVVRKVGKVTLAHRGAKRLVRMDYEATLVISIICCISLGCENFHFWPTTGFSMKPLKFNLLAGQQTATVCSKHLTFVKFHTCPISFRRHFCCWQAEVLASFGCSSDTLATITEESAEVVRMHAEPWRHSETPLLLTCSGNLSRQTSFEEGVRQMMKDALGGVQSARMRQGTASST